tara:strand:- start:933 stop:1259 length:327 start_codon:yes stop_codon:yes gene_type:complete
MYRDDTTALRAENEALRVENVEMRRRARDLYHDDGQSLSDMDAKWWRDQFENTTTEAAEAIVQEEVKPFWALVTRKKKFALALVFAATVTPIIKLVEVCVAVYKEAQE